jgi:antiviral helicase SKI2
MNGGTSIEDEAEQRRQAISDIVNAPGREAAQRQLAQLQLDGVPSREQIFKDIEQRILLPKRTLPDHWLPTYQMYVFSSMKLSVIVHRE